MTRRATRLMAAVTAAALCGANPALAQTAAGKPMVTAQPDPGAAIAPYVVDPASDTAASRDALIASLRQKVKYVFVIFNENHSFDNEYGTFPGANGLYSDGTAPRDAAHTPGLTETYTDASGKPVTVTAFGIGPQQNATFVDSVDHSHTGLAQKLHVTNNVAAMDNFAGEEYARFASKGGAANQAMGTQFADLVMSHIDCDTIPFFWQYASRFALFDNIFATEDTPSTPNAIAMIAGQSGETQWVEHGSDPRDVKVGNHSGKLQAPPLRNDPQPFWGSQYDTTSVDRQPAGPPAEFYGDNNVATNLTFASLPLSFAKGGIAELTKQDRQAEADLADVTHDVPFIQSRGGKPINWRWYQAGYDHEPNDPGADATHAMYVSHHQGPQYFGYVSNNQGFARNLRGEGDLFADLRSGNMPVDGGVFYVRGGFGNLTNMTPPIQNADYPNPAGLTQAEIATINKTKSGDDDHPSYTDRQISETMAARVINEIAARPEIWSQSAIIITYDESDGFYDHVPPRILSYDPDGLPQARGIRIPLILISPYARAHVVSHAEGDHNAVIETIEAIFDMPPLASLPDEKQALVSGEDAKFDGPNGFVQHYLGPRDINTPATDDLLSAFEPKRLSGEMPPLPASYAMIPDNVVESLPHYGGKGCQAIGMTPEDKRQGISTPIPAHFNTLPATLPAYN